MSLSFLDKINFPSDLKELSLDNLEDLAIELRNKTIDTVSKTGGHLVVLGQYMLIQLLNP